MLVATWMASALCVMGDRAVNPQMPSDIVRVRPAFPTDHLVCRSELLSVNSKKSQLHRFTVALDAFSRYKFWYESVCTRCQTKHCSTKRSSQELFPLWTGEQSETTCYLYSTANRRRATTCQSIGVDGLSFTVLLLRN
jgi:hypothetical protein